MVKLGRRLSLLLLLVVSSTAWSELIIRVTQGNDNTTIVAVSPISLNGLAVKQDIAALAEADLERSGLFRATQRRDMLAVPSRSSDVD